SGDPGHPEATRAAAWREDFWRSLWIKLTEHYCTPLVGISSISVPSGWVRWLLPHCSKTDMYSPLRFLTLQTLLRLSARTSLPRLRMLSICSWREDPLS